MADLVERTPHIRVGGPLFLATGTLSQMAASLAQQGTIVLGVFFAALYSLDLSQMGEVIAAMTLGWVVSGLFIGTLVDLYGPRRVLFVGTLVLTCECFWLGVVVSLTGTVILLFLLGVSLGTVPLSGTKAVMMAWPRERRGMPIGIRQMGVPLGSMLAALTLPSLAGRVGLHSIYFGMSALLLVCGLIFCAVLPPRAPTPLSKAQPHLRLRGESRVIVAPVSAGFLLAWGQYSILTYTIPLLHGWSGMSLTLAGLALALAQVGGGVGRVFFGWLSDRMGGRPENVLQLTALSGAGLAVALMTLPRHPSFLVVAALWLVLGVMMVGWNALILTWVGQRVSEGNAGGAMGFTTSAILLGATVCTPVFGWIVEISGTYRAGWLTLALILTSAAVVLRLSKQRADAVALREERRDEPALAGRA